jgi:hypothetical protein
VDRKLEEQTAQLEVHLWLLRLSCRITNDNGQMKPQR